jgi:hypothetical protein
MAFDEYFLKGLQAGAEMASKKRDREQELYLKSQPSTYTYTDPATGEAKTYTVATSLSPDIMASLEEKVLGRLRGGKKQITPQLAATPEEQFNSFRSEQSVPSATSVPPGMAVFQQGGKAQMIKTATGGKDSPAEIAQKNLSGTGRFLEQFGRSYNELKTAYPEIGDVGFTGWATRKGASIANALDSLPETKAFQVELQPLANQMARDVEGGRVTDQDRKVYADAFANTLKNPSQTNIRLVANKLLTLKDRGGDISKVLSELYSSDIDIMQNISKEVLKSSPELKQKILMQVYQNNPNRFEVVNE